MKEKKKPPENQETLKCGKINLLEICFSSVFLNLKNQGI
jgi:hypothetical protein